MCGEAISDAVAEFWKTAYLGEGEEAGNLIINGTENSGNKPVVIPT